MSMAIASSLVHHTSYVVPDLICSVCTASDIRTWIYTSKNLLKFVPSKHYLLIVPDCDVKTFQYVTDTKFTVVPESKFIHRLKDQLKERTPASAHPRLGWYLQQFIKLSVLYEARSLENYVIWDADTIPLKRIDFFRKNGEVEFFVGSEAHPPYFDLTEKLLGVGKVAEFSFIAQCFPCKGLWANEFFNFIENKFQDSYINVLMRLINFEQSSGFSEYETLGSFVLSKFPQQVLIKQKKWLRNGSALIGAPENVNREPYTQLINDYEHVTFEKWESPYSILKIQDEPFRHKFLKIEASKLPTLDSFLEKLFTLEQVRTVIQIGANDGVQNDPLRRHLQNSTSFKATLIEPIPYYINKLQELYLNRKDVSVVQAAAGSSEGRRELFFIPPELADEMNGDGPQNNWAHGQGSFDKDIVVHWIKQNAFRGKKYVDRIEHYIESITSMQVEVHKTDSLLGKNRCGMLLLIDVQGFELDVLNGVDWEHPPEWVIIENDLGKSFDHISYFSNRGFNWVGGEHDKIFSRIK